MKKMKHFFRSLIILTLVFAFIVPAGIHADEQEEKIVRVGWHDAPYFMIDQYGRRSGYSYEYQCKVAAYTGWTYEYVTDSWSNLLKKLEKGEIDVMSNVSYTAARAEKFLYSSLPMGSESYYIFISPNETEITADDYSTLNGKRVGVTEGTIQIAMFENWANVHGISVDLIEINGPDEESLRMLGDKLDAFITMDVYGDPETAIPFCKIGSSDFYFAVNKDRPDLLIELDAALNRIQDDNKNYNYQLNEKYLRNVHNELYLSNKELNYLNKHGKIIVGYQDNYMAFCAKEPVTGELTGALKTYLEYASTALENANLVFEAIAYPTASAAMEAMKKGEVDCVFPANLTDYDSEILDVVMTPAIMRTEMDAVVREADQKEFIIKDDVTVAVNEGNTNYDMFLADHYPKWKRVYYKDTPTGLEAVAKGEADCVIISNYRFSNVSKQCEKLHLTTIYTGVDMDYCFAVSKGNTDLYSILSRVANAVPDATIHTALTYYSTEDVKTSFTDLIKDNLLIVMSVIAAVLFIILILLLHNISAERKIIEEEKMVKDLNKKVYVDALTSVKNKRSFADFTNELQDRISNEDKIEYAVGIFDCDDLKMINDKYGHDKGDIYIRTACKLICNVFQHSPVFRIGGDEFAIIMQNEDYINRDELIIKFKEEREKQCADAKNKWEEPHISLGIAVYNPKMDEVVGDTIRRADKDMYESKQVNKKTRI